MYFRLSLVPRPLPAFQCVTLKSWEWPGDKATSDYIFSGLWDWLGYTWSQSGSAITTLGPVATTVGDKSANTIYVHTKRCLFLGEEGTGE